MVGIARALEPLERAEAKKRQGTRTDKHPATVSGSSIGNTRDKLAAVVGVSHLTLTRARKVVEAAEREPQRFSELLAEMDKTGNVSAAFAQLQRLERREAARDAGRLPNGKFRVVLADPPWRYDIADGAPHTDNGSATNHYRTMSIADLCSLPVKEHVEKNAVLFLWTTSPMMMDCRAVIEAWGFAYKASFVWDKIRPNFGYYNSVRHEFLLICARGTCTPDRPTPLLDSVVSLAKSGVHSEKPEEFRKIIERLYPFGRRLELFGRRQVKGWTVWGDQVPAPRKNRD
jgi:site-specific DNA-methyltransferase (adenine-specific)